MSIIDNPPADYVVDVTLGDYAWSTAKGDAPDLGLIDPLSIGWTLPENGTAYPQPEPMWATFAVALQSTGDLIGVDIGTPVTIKIYDPSAFPGGELFAHFRGRLAGASLQPRKILAPVGLLDAIVATFQAVDYTIDLAESVVGLAAWPAETAQARSDRILNEAGVAVPITWPPSWFTLAPMRARSAGATDARAAMVRLVDSLVTVDDIHDGSRRNVLVPNFLTEADPSPDPLEPLTFQPAFNRYYAGERPDWRLPGAFVQTVVVGVWGIDIGEPAAQEGMMAVLDASIMDFDSSWTLSKNDHSDTVTVPGPFTTPTPATSVTVSGPNPIPITLTLDTDLDDTQWATPLAQFNLTTSDSDRWNADEFTFYVDKDVRRLIWPTPVLLDDQYPLATFVPYVIRGIPESQSPTLTSWVAGQLAGITLTMSKGRFAAKVRLRRNVPRPQITPAVAAFDVGYITPYHLSLAPYAAITPADLDQRFSCYDYRIVRNPHA